MSLRSDRLLAAVALRQDWIDERLAAVEAKLKLTPPVAPVPAEDPAEHLRLATSQLLQETEHRAERAA